MALIKIRLNTWTRNVATPLKFKRRVAPREGYIDMHPGTKEVQLRQGSHKWKPWDTGISRKTDASYINDRKDMYSGLCFKSRKDAKKFMEKHKTELDEIAAQNPLFDHWSIMNIIGRFEPDNKLIYGVDIKE